MKRPVFQEIPVELTDPNPDNPRHDTGDVTDLAESIRRVGVLQPVVAVQKNGRYVVVAGSRRLKAARLVGLDTIPAAVRELAATEAEEIAIVENVVRSQLSPIEEALSYAKIMKTRGLHTQVAVGELLGVGNHRVSQRLALLRLPKHVINLVHTGEMSVKQALQMEQESRPTDGRHNPRPGASRCVIETHRGCGRGCEVRQLLDQMDRRAA